MAIGWRTSGAAVLAVAVSVGHGGAASHAPLAFFAPAVAIEDGDRERLDSGRVVVKVLPGHGRELAIFAAVRVNTEPERLIAWGQRAEVMQRGRYVPATARFSAPPALADVEGLRLPDDDLEDIRRCRPGDCGLKLSALEMEELQRGINGSSDWKTALQRGFRQAIVTRATAYLANGDLGAAPYEDDAKPVRAETEFASLLYGLGFLNLQMPQLAKYLQLYPRLENPDIVDSFVYWSTETLGIKPITSVTHVTVMRGVGRGEPAALVASKQVFASHYKDASLGVMAITGSSEGRYLVYIHRSHVDVLEGTLGGLVRRMVERRVRDEAPDVVLALRRTLEGGR
jgi:hypothetical protein